MNKTHSPLFYILSTLVVVALCFGCLGTYAVATRLAFVQGQNSSSVVASEDPATKQVEENNPTTNDVVENTPAPAQPATASDRISRLVELDAIYRAQGWQAWLKAAGVSCDANVEARQPEEETVVYNGETRVVVSGLQVKGNCKVPYPALVTTDRPGEVTTGADSRTYQPDLKNPSVLYTNVQLHGQGTVWVDGSNWGQLDPTK